MPAPSSAPPIALLSGIRVVDLTTSIAGPYAAMLLGDMGAEVVKVERPGAGDDSRAWGPPFLDGESLWFLSVNRNKRSVTLDYNGESGRRVLHDLVCTADIVIVNLVGRVQKKLGLDYSSLKEIRPDLVFVSLTGFGLEGVRKDFPCSSKRKSPRLGEHTEHVLREWLGYDGAAIQSLRNAKVI